MHLPMQEIQGTRILSLHQEDPLEEGMTTHSSILAWENHMARGAWQAAVYGVSKSRTQLKRPSTHAHVIKTNPKVTENNEYLAKVKKTKISEHVIRHNFFFVSVISQ